MRGRLSSQIYFGSDRRNKRRSGVILGEGGTVWEMASASLHIGVFLDSEERHERASHCACDYDDFVSERFDYFAGDGSRGDSVGCRFGEGFRASWSSSCVGSDDAFHFPRKIMRVLCGNFKHQYKVQFEGCVSESLQTITAILLGSKWSCLLLRIALQDA